jgi:hypothetical protein
MWFGGGFGVKGFGAGSLTVIRAAAVDGQTVRVVFNQRPLADSPIGPRDAQNVANYRFLVVTGTGGSPTPVGVAPTIVQGPARGPVLTGQWGVDVRVDRPLVAGLTYRVLVANVQAASGDSLGAPTDADFPGIVTLHPRAPTAAIVPGDLATNPFTGAFAFDSAGDLDTHAGLPSLRKRVMRRLGTIRGAFRFLRAYGLALPFKKPLTDAAVGGLQTDGGQQLRREPEIADATVGVTKQGATTWIEATWSTKTGLDDSVGLQSAGGGRFSISPP